MLELSSVFGPRRIIGVIGDRFIYSAHDLQAGTAELTTVRASDAFVRPDLDDPATCGCFETLNREAWSPVGGGRRVEIGVAPRCRYDETGRPVPMYAVRVLVLCDTWRLEWETSKEEWQPTRGLALAHALLSAPTKGDGR